MQLKPSIFNFSGIMNTDDPPEVCPFSHHIDARNVVFRGTAPRLRAQNIEGTREIPFILPAGNNECIGAFFDPKRQRIFWFNANDNSRHGIYMIDLATETITTLLLSFTTSAGDILHFDANFPIVSVNILYRSTTEGDVLHWCERLNRPRKLNIVDVTSNVYGNNWTENHLTVARPYPGNAPICSYADDNTVTTNNLKRKLYEFRYRHVSRDFTKSNWSTWSKLFAPANPDSVADDRNPQKNNRIDVQVRSGPSDATYIEIAARKTIGIGYSNPFLVASINKSQSSIADNIIYTFPFYNNEEYTDIDIEESDQLFDYIPKIANAQEMLNGNVLTYGGYTFGYNFNTSTIDVTATITTVDNGVNTQPFQITISNNQFTTGNPSAPFGGNFNIYMTGSPQAGDQYSIGLVAFDGTATPTSLLYTINYTVVGGDTLTSVITFFKNAFNAASGFNTVYHLQCADIVGTPGGFYVFSPTGTGQILTYQTNIIYFNPTPTTATDVNIAAFKAKSRYGFAIIYKDQFGVSPGAYITSAMSIETPEMDTTGLTQFKIPNIKFSINHTPPIWAYSMEWARTDSLTYESLLTTPSCDANKDGTSYVYFDITNLQKNISNLPVYEFKSGDRVRVVGLVGGSVSVADVVIIDVVESPKLLNTTVLAGTQLKVAYDTVFSGVGGGNKEYYLEIYTPRLNNSPSVQVYKTFGETYDILNPGTSGRVHQGKLQDQTNVQPAIYNFQRGDFYIRQRVYPILADQTQIQNLWIVSQSVSDAYPSLVSGTGSSWINDPYAREIFYPNNYQWSLDYEQDTNINRTNRFYPQNFDTIDRQKGSVQRMYARQRIMRIFQDRGVGEVGIYHQFIKDGSGNNSLILSNTLITQNNINYYEGEWGMGEQYCSLASAKEADYFTDPIKGYQIRLSGDGMIPISELYHGVFYLRGLMLPYGHKTWLRPNGKQAKLIGIYDGGEEHFLTIFQGGTNGADTIKDEMLSFNEPRNAYASFYDPTPEWIISANNNVYMWKNGRFYAQDSTNFNTFFGVKYDSYITVPFNIPGNESKTFRNLFETASSVWDCPLIFTDDESYPAQRQESALIIQDFTRIKAKFNASLLYDIHSYGGINNGEYLTGNMIAIKFRNSAATLQWLNLLEILYNT